jgi:NADPH:quinone reductase
MLSRSIAASTFGVNWRR